MRITVARISVLTLASVWAISVVASEQIMDFPDSYRVSTKEVMIPGNGKAPRHLHPGVESVYIASGGGTLYLAGQSPRVMQQGDIVLVPSGIEHRFDGGIEATTIVSTYVVERGRPATDGVGE